MPYVSHKALGVVASVAGWNSVFGQPTPAHDVGGGTGFSDSDAGTGSQFIPVSPQHEESDPAFLIEPFVPEPLELTHQGPVPGGPTGPYSCPADGGCELAGQKQYAHLHSGTYRHIVVEPTHTVDSCWASAQCMNCFPGDRLTWEFHTASVADGPFDKLIPELGNTGTQCGNSCADPVTTQFPLNGAEVRVTCARSHPILGFLPCEYKFAYACKEYVPTPEPTPEPTSEPTPEPTPEPTVTPAVMIGRSLETDDDDDDGSVVIKAVVGGLIACCLVAAVLTLLKRRRTVRRSAEIQKQSIETTQEFSPLDLAADTDVRGMLDENVQDVAEEINADTETDEDEWDNQPAPGVQEDQGVEVTPAVELHDTPAGLQADFDAGEEDI